MNHNKKNVIVYDCEDDEIQPFVEGVNRTSTVKFEMIQRRRSIAENHHRTGKIGDLKRYIDYFQGGLQLYIHRRDYAHIVCWQQFYALTYGYYCNLFGNKTQCEVIACNFAFKEKRGKTKTVYKKFIQKSLRGNNVSYLHIPSKNYAKRICADFNYNKDNIIISTFGISDVWNKYSILAAPDGYKKNSYMLAIGRSNRDYDFLIDVWEKVHYPLVIISDTYKGTTNNPYIKIRRDIGGEDQYAWINNCKANIICLKDGNIASGDTVLLTSMSLAKIVVVSSPSTLAEMYIENKKNGLIINKHIEEFRDTIKEIIEGKYDYLGAQARKIFLGKYSREHLGEEIGKYIK